MASVDRERDEERPLDLLRFNSIIEEYSSSFQNPPKNAHQIAQFCKDRRYSLKYGQIAPFFNIWSKQQESKTTSTTTGGPIVTKGAVERRDSDEEEEEEEEDEIDWDAFWDEYKEKYQYVPKKAVHLWNFAREDKKLLTIKYKEARAAFDRIVAERAEVCSPKPVEGRTRSNTDLGLKSAVSSMSMSTLGSIDGNKIELKLKIGRYSSEEDVDSIKSSFLECLESFRAAIKHDPANALQLFNFINEDTTYKVRYGDVKSCLNYATKHKWFKPMKRMKKVYKTKKDEGSSPDNDDNEVVASEVNDSSDGEGVQFVLEVDHEKIEAEKRKQAEAQKKVVVLEVMADDEFDAVLLEYNNHYENPPRNASQIMNFAKEFLGQIYKYKACRIAFNRWKNCRGSVMPSKAIKKEEEESDHTEPEQPGQIDGKSDSDEEEEDEEEEEEESD